MSQIGTEYITPGVLSVLIFFLVRLLKQIDETTKVVIELRERVTLVEHQVRRFHDNDTSAED